ncbi:MAG: U32 family peptidase [Myxococcales bacterium]|nr:U32 family peptidase [Myxococcales bacterium]
MKLSVACNFDDALIPALAPYPVYEVYGKLTSDVLGGGRPSFYLPEIGRSELERYVRLVHERGIEFNYLLNSSATGNLEFTRQGQRDIDELLEWVAAIGVDSVTVAHIYFLRLVKKRYPKLKVRVSSHRFTDNPRKVRFWAENGADYVVVSEVNIHRELKILRGMQRAAVDSGVELQLIVNNWCRQDCAIAGNHAVGLSEASRVGSKGFPLDYCSLVCNQIRVTEPVNYIRANWIRPDDLPIYEEIGFRNFKIVERNTPTPVLQNRVKAYAERRYDGNLLDLVQNYAYPEAAFGGKAQEAYSLKRMLRYFAKPGAINLFRLGKVIDFGKTLSVLYPLRGENPVQIDNRALDGFMERFDKHSCQDLDCESCRYCHRFAEKAVRIDPAWRERIREIFVDLLDDVDGGAFFEAHSETIRQGLGRAVRSLRVLD